MICESTLLNKISQLLCVFEIISHASNKASTESEYSLRYSNFT